MSKFNRGIARKTRVLKCGATSKRCFKSHESALEFIGGLDDAPTMRSYRCNFCGHSHITSHA